ncbi:MAG TPA: ISAs1 family transposase, partial [Verrucomicrobiae bacterium]|nr:ISAs1 family transposase [Verrucomicrobiae bacterium]
MDTDAIASKKSLVDHLSIITDPRVNGTRDHALIEILVIALCGLLCRAETFNDLEDFGNAKQDWFKTFLELPKWDSFPRNFHSCFQRFRPERIPGGVLELTQSLRQAVPHEIVAMDGKALRRALTADKNPKYIVSAWAEENGLVLGQLKVDEKSNEITAVPQLLRVLELRGCIVTLDAMG